MSNNQYTLKDLLTIKNGTDYKELSDGNIPVYGTGGIMRYVDDFLYDGESILLPRKGTLSNICYTNGKFWTVDTMYWTIVNEDLAYPKFLYCYLSLLDLSHRDSGSTLPSMTFDSYYSIPIDLPPMKVQKLVGDFIFKLNKKIENNNKINAELESAAKTIYDYWFLQFEFPNEEGKPYKSSGGKMVWNEELKREIPEGWNLDIINNAIEQIVDNRGKNPSKYYEAEKYPVIDNFLIKNTPYPSMSEVKRYINQDLYDNFLRTYNRKNDVIITLVGNGIGNVSLIPSDKVAIIQNTIALRCNEKISNFYLYFYCINNNKLIKALDRGSSQPSIKASDIFSLKILFPDQNISKRYKKLCTSIFNKILENCKENQELIKLRDFILPLLMNGQIGFKDNLNEEIEHKEVEQREFSNI